MKGYFIQKCVFPTYGFYISPVVDLGLRPGPPQIRTVYFLQPSHFILSTSTSVQR